MRLSGRRRKSYFRHGLFTLYSGVAVTVALLMATSLRRTSHAIADCAALFDYTDGLGQALIADLDRCAAAPLLGREP